MSKLTEMPEAVADAVEVGIQPVTAFRVAEEKTIPELAADADLDPVRVAEIEAGSTPDLDELTALGEALDVVPDLLLD